LVSNNGGSTAKVKGNYVMNQKTLAQQQLWPSSRNYSEENHGQH